MQVYTQPMQLSYHKTQTYASLHTTYAKIRLFT